MLVSKPVIYSETREVLEEHLRNHFQTPEGIDLDAVVAEILHDKDLFTFLAIHLDEEKGLYLGSMRYDCDEIIPVHYGLTLDFKVPRKSQIFYYRDKSIERQEKISLCDIVPHHQGCPSPKQFITQINNVLKNPKDYLITFYQGKGPHLPEEW